jgi:prophage regulatory protein
MTEAAEPLPPQFDRLIREDECHERTGLSRTTRWRLERAKLFPRRIWLTDNIIAWRLSEISEWIEERVAAKETAVKSLRCIKLAKARGAKRSAGASGSKQRAS